MKTRLDSRIAKAVAYVIEQRPWLVAEGVRAFILADLGNDHRQWLDGATAGDIADWVLTNIDRFEQGDHRRQWTDWTV